MSNFITIFNIIIISIILTNALKIILFNNISKKFQKLEPINENQDVFLYVLIPVLREQDIILKTITHFLKCLKNKNAKIIIITTEKEKYEKYIEINKKNFLYNLKNDFKKLNKKNLILKYNKVFSEEQIEYLINLINVENKISKNKLMNIIKNFPTTEELIRMEKFNEDKIEIINYPFHEGYMAHQLNYAIKKLKKQQKNKKLFFSIYNADSNPNIETFNEFFNKINFYPKEDIFQQYSINNNNFKKISNILKGMSIYQNAFEMENGIINNSISTFLYSHVVGHGLFISEKFINEVNNFNTDFWCEDIFLTAQTKILKKNIIFLNTVEEINYAKTLKIQIHQSATWFNTSKSFLKIFMFLVKKHGFNKNIMFWLFSEIINYFEWAVFPIIFIFLNLFLIYSTQIKLFILNLCIFILYIFVKYFYYGYIFPKKMFNKEFDNINKVLLFFYLLQGYFFSAIGPIYSYIKKEKFKTPN